MMQQPQAGCGYVTRQVIAAQAAQAQPVRVSLRTCMTKWEWPSNCCTHVKPLSQSHSLMRVSSEEVRKTGSVGCTAIDLHGSVRRAHSGNRPVAKLGGPYFCQAKYLN